MKKVKAKMKSLEQLKSEAREITETGSIHLENSSAWIPLALYDLCGKTIEINSWNKNDGRGFHKGWTITRPMLEYVESEMNRNGANSISEGANS